ncbi:MAG: hypothetical protein BECKG1743D_GA0114223_105605 [Candidatus Kentron sp. G]|nr:MAG: hypothetical protein BECKG1743F_GA0114225_106691 [Candidatus Kentron sp. G]VFN03953.1 MAG: hypothetical protein BECKG1743E_GA0114224_106754 [Candidatus Kentron sp. G]VFN04221.1 MAG: hypothetical protein BECKG1743D_GA0114223_105605 [Candidatus Kentron sp. G]
MTDAQNTNFGFRIRPLPREEEKPMQAAPPREPSPPVQKKTAPKPPQAPSTAAPKFGYHLCDTATPLRYQGLIY